jgi:hypothetical protein
MVRHPETTARITVPPAGSDMHAPKSDLPTARPLLTNPAPSEMTLWLRYVVDSFGTRFR